MFYFALHAGLREIAGDQITTVNVSWKLFFIREAEKEKIAVILASSQVKYSSLYVIARIIFN